MSELTITQMPYINGQPDSSSTQLAIDWIKSGEPLNGASSMITDDGTLNRVTSQLQENIEVLDANAIILTNEVISINNNLVTINEALGTSGDATFVERLTTAETNISNSDSAIQTNASNIQLVQVEADATKTNVGTYNASVDSVYRTVRDDLVFIKKQMGNYTGQDINAQYITGLAATGMKLKLETTAASASSSANRLSVLEGYNIPSIQTKLATALKSTYTFTTGGTLTSNIDLISDGTSLYTWTGSYPKVVTPNYDPSVDGYKLGAWAAVNDAILRNALASSSGYTNLGQVESYAALKSIIPKAEGDRIVLASYYEGFGKGGGEFISVNSAANDDSGSICSVNSNWHWKRVKNAYYSPEMFGAIGDGTNDDSAPINLAISAAIVAGLDEVVGYGIYSVNGPIYVYGGLHSSTVSGADPRFGFGLYLNVVLVNPVGWSALPDEWWTAKGVFMPPSGVETENYRLYVNELDCANVAHGVSTTDGAINTSHIHIGMMRNYIIGYKDYLGQIFSSGMTKVTGYNWQNGYIGVLQGGTGVNGEGNGECLEVNINWCANHKYTGLSLQDRSQYFDVKGGTYDYNGQEASLLTLTNLSSTDSYVVEFGNTITNGTVSSFALSSIMNYNGDQTLLVTESSNKKDGTSDYKIGDVITYGTWSATISAITLTSAVNPFYFDVVISDRTGDFAKCNIQPTYLGGYVGHNLFTNTILCPNSTASVDSMNWRGLGIAGGVDSSYWYIKHLYKDNPIFEFYDDNMVINTRLELKSNTLCGYKVQWSAQQSIASNAISFSYVDNEADPAYYNINIGSSISAQFGRCVLRVGQSALYIIPDQYGLIANLVIDVDGNNLVVTAAGSPAILTLTATRVI